jgi:hypothetical protein
MTRPLFSLLLTLLALATPAQALKLTVWDPEIKIKVGYGETTASRMTVELLQNYNGPVKLVFAREEDEKARGLYPTLQSSYEGALKAGTLTLNIGNTTVTFSKFLSNLKLTLVLQPTGQIFTLPGLRTATDPTDKPTPDRANPDRANQGGR